MGLFQAKLPGIFFCLLLSSAASYLGQLFPLLGGPVFAILLGMLLAKFFQGHNKLHAGVNFTAKKILQLAVVLLGFGLNLTDILRCGQESLPIISITILTALFVAYLLSKALALPGNISILVGVGSAICGGSAIAATAPVIAAKDEEVAQAISVIFLFNIIAAVAFPLLGEALGLSNEGFGLFAGTAINDTSSVTAAATVWDGLHSSNTLATATIVKLTRTLAIIPLTFVLGLLAAQNTAPENTPANKVQLKSLVPFFILAFVLASILTTILALPPVVTGFTKNLSKFFIIMAMAGIGLNTDFGKLVKTGGKPILLGFCCWLAICLASLLSQHWLKIW